MDANIVLVILRVELVASTRRDFEDAVLLEPITWDVNGLYTGTGVNTGLLRLCNDCVLLVMGDTLLVANDC